MMSSSMERAMVWLDGRYERKHRESGQQMESRWSRNTIVTKVTIAIATVTMVTERDVGFASAQLW